MFKIKTRTCAKSVLSSLPRTNSAENEWSSNQINFTLTAQNPYNSSLFSMPIDEFELGPAIVMLKTRVKQRRSSIKIHFPSEW